MNDTHIIGKLLRAGRNEDGSCTIQGPVIGESAHYYTAQVDYGEGYYQGPRRFRKVGSDLLGRWNQVQTHIEPCEHCPDYVTTQQSNIAAETASDAVE